VEAGRFVMAWIGIVDIHASRVRPVSAAGDDVASFLDAAPLAILECAPGCHDLVGQAIGAKAPVLSNDVKNDPRRMMHKELDERGINSLAILPLVVNNEAVGVIALYSAEVGFFDDGELRLLSELAGDISYALDHIQKARRLNYVSYYDTLTALPNRTLFAERLKLQLDDARRKQEKVALTIVDVERFKTINDTLGRQAGDALLVELASRIQRCAPASSWSARIGADQIAIVTPAVSSAADLARRSETQHAEVFGPPFTFGATELRVSARLGIALCPDDALDPDGLLRSAEAALKNAKATGERYLFYTQEMTERVAEKLALENKLRQALERDEFVLHYQPKVDAHTRGIVGLEALIRWRSPELGLVSPGKFVPLLEETGLILQVGSWALRRAALDHRRWLEAALAPPRVAVNVSPIQTAPARFRAGRRAGDRRRCRACQHRP
jgi:diguanylate cyclase (GGDEF)-like protein